MKYIYVIDMPGHPYCKVGMTQDVNQRFAQLQIANPYSLRMYFCRLTDKRITSYVESETHRRFSKHNAVGEWFDANSNDVVNAVNSIISDIEENGAPEDIVKGVIGSKNCESCGEEFLLKRVNLDQRFCSSSCAGGHRKNRAAA